MKTKILSTFVVILLVVLGWSLSFSSVQKKNNNYEKYIKSAQENCDLKIYKYAEKDYRKALSINSSDVDIHKEYLDVLKELGKNEDVIAEANYLVTKFQKNINDYDVLAKLYFNK